VLTVDVEDYFHVEAFCDIVDRESWPTYTCRVETNTRRLLELFNRHNVKATFFVLGWVAERWPGIIREIAAEGHELACHSYWHRLIYKLRPDEFREDTIRAKRIIEEVAGAPVTGYRAPSYSVIRSSLWALEILAELGFTYDSSIFPIHHDVYGIPDAPRRPFRVSTQSGPIIEYPITTFRLGGKNMPVGGGGYLRLLPFWYTRYGVRRAEQDSVPLVVYVHPWEVDPGQPRLAGRWKARFRHYTNLDSMYGRLESLLKLGGFTTFRDAQLQAEQCFEANLV
jgi:polysaccharide deacetylase family protein (PEP-CTERM system associated)